VYDDGSDELTTDSTPVQGCNFYTARDHRSGVVYIFHEQLVAQGNQQQVTETVRSLQIAADHLALPQCCQISLKSGLVHSLPLMTLIWRASAKEDQVAQTVLLTDMSVIPMVLSS
jgi:hypothetical protein